MKKAYEFADIASFLGQRSWFVVKIGMVTQEEYDGFKAGTYRPSKTRAAYLRGFVKGWMLAKR